MEVILKGVTSGDVMHVDEQGRHLIFRNINGRVRPIRVSAEDFADWLEQQGVNIDPADQKTLRELDKELEIMERAAEYGGPKFQKQYENYFNQMRQQFQQMTGSYYQQAIQNQAANNQMTPEQLQASAQNLYQTYGDEEAEDRTNLPNRGWVSAAYQWVQSQDVSGNLTQQDDDWYYNRIYGTLISALSEAAKEQKPLSQINIDDVFSDEFIKYAMSSYYGDFFGGSNADPKKIVAAVKTFQKYLKDFKYFHRDEMKNFIDYWYSRMYDDFSKTDQEPEILESSPITSGVSSVPKEIVPKNLPKHFGTSEEKALMGLYNSSSGSKLNAAHRVMIHGIGRLINSIPANERMAAAVELSNPKSGMHAVHKEAYKRAYKDRITLEVTSERLDLLRNALSIAKNAAKGSTKDKVTAIKRISMIMGAMDGAAMIDSNPGIQESNFTRKWHETATNAGRVKSEGPGLIDLLANDDFRNASIYTNEDLRIVHDGSSSKEDKDVQKKKDEETTKKKPINKDIGDGYKFYGKKLYTPDGYVAWFENTPYNYSNVTVHSPEDKPLFDLKIYLPPMKISEMDEDDRQSYFDSIKLQIQSVIDNYKKFKSQPEEKDNNKEDNQEDENKVIENTENDQEEGPPSFVDQDDASFRVPIFDFGDVNLTNEDREFVGQVIEHVDQYNLSVDKISPGIYRITNPINKKTFDVLLNSRSKKLVGASKDSEGKVIPFPQATIEDFASQLELRSS